LSIAFRLLIVLLAAIPALAIAHEGFVRHVTPLAVAVILVGATLDPLTDVATVAQLLRRFSLAMLFPILWMVLQVVPLPASWPANPIWSTASAALGDASSSAHVSVDPAATLRSLVTYLTMLALIVASAIVARDRHRAETIFYVLSTVATFMSLEVLISQRDAFKDIVPAAGSAPVTFVAMAALATLANGAIIIMAIERHLSRRNAENSPIRPLILRLVLAAFGLGIAVAATRSLASGGVQAATALGFAAIIFVAIARRLEFHSWLSVALFLVLAGIAATIIIPQLRDTSQTGLAKFAASSPAEALALAARAMSGTPWLGNGVGTFRSLVPIYQDFGTVPALEPPSTAIAVAIEWGTIALAITIAFAAQLFLFTFRGAVRRGRDSYFAATAAAGVLVMLCEAFCDPSLLDATVQIAAAVLIGLGLSQSVGRTKALK
jgi:hypothetical protein